MCSGLVCLHCSIRALEIYVPPAKRGPNAVGKSNTRDDRILLLRDSVGLTGWQAGKNSLPFSLCAMKVSLNIAVPVPTITYPINSINLPYQILVG